MNHQLPIKINLPEHYLEEEVRCGYTISTQMKRVWAIELDLLNEVNRICTKYNLIYYADKDLIEIYKGYFINDKNFPRIHR